MKLALLGCAAMLALAGCSAGGAREIRSAFADLDGARIVAQESNVAIIEFDSLPDRSVLFLNGIITQGTERGFRELLPKAIEQNTSDEPTPFLLNSPGGQTVPALRMGLTAREAGLATVVAESTCVSSCALLWLAGAERRAFGEARIGFHAPHWFLLQTRADFADDLVREYLDALGYSENTADVALQADANEMVWLTPELANALDLDVNAPRR